MTDYIDRPLLGVADFGGVPHRFCLLGWESIPPSIADQNGAFEAWLDEHWNPDEDRYELVPLTPSTAETVWVRATFTGNVPGLGLPAGGPAAIRASWRLIPIAERLDYLLEIQRFGGRFLGGGFGSALLCVAFWLADADLEAIRPELTHDDSYPDVGEVGRYRGVPVFSMLDRPLNWLRRSFHQGVRFAYGLCDHLD